jgi:hypothetical protein
MRTGSAFGVRLSFSRLISALLLCALASAAPAADPWSVLAEAAATRDAGEARKQLEALLLEQPDFHAGHFNLGTLLLDSDPEAAAAHLERATASPQAELAADAWHNLALARWKQGRLEDAVAAAGKAVELRPDQPEAQRLRDELRRVLIARADEARRKAEEEARKLHLATRALPDAHVGEAYDQRIAAAGGKPDYRFSLGAPAAPAKAPAAGMPAPAPAPAALPEGFVLDADGRLHGTPAKAGRYDLPLAIRDAAGTTIDGALTLTVIPAPAITTAQLPEAILGSPYQAELASEGLADPAWTVDGLPPGLALQPGRGASATIRGTPERAGAFTLRVTADDGQRRASSAPPPAGGIPLTVSELFAPEQAVLPPATAWAPYRFQLGVRGPPQTYRWQAKPQSGMTIAENGAVGGTPQQAGTLTLHATILAEDGRSRDVTVTLPVNPPPVIQESAPIELTEGQAVDRPLAVAGGTPPYLWHLADGVLPKGLRLDPDGALRGAPTERGTTEVTVALHDHWQAATQQKMTVTVKPSEKKQDQQKDQQKQEDQAKQDQQKDGKQGDQQKQDQQKDGKQGDQQKQDQVRKDPSGQPKDDQQKQQGGQQKQGERQQGDQAKGERGEGQRPAGQDAAQQAQVLNQVAADRWLDQLPKENRGVLRYQLLEGGEKTAPRKDGKTW